MADLSSLLTSSRQLTAHIPRPDLPTINLGLDQIEQQSRRLVAGQPTAPDQSKASYLLAQAQIDTSVLGSQVANLNTNQTFAPLQPINDTDIAGFVRHAHEQSLIASIEEGRRETEAEFYRVLEERSRRDWENRKKKIFEELGVKVDSTPAIPSTEYAGVANAFGKSRLAASTSGRGLGLNTSVTQTKQTMPMHQKMMAYDRVLSHLNNARLAQTAFPLIFQFKAVASETPQGSSSIGQQFAETLEILLEITGEQPQLPHSHAQAHLLNNSPVLERSFAKPYLADPQSTIAAELREKIVNGARTALEKQYWQFLEQTVHSKPMDAALGGDPGLANKVRAFLSVRFYKSGRWEDRLELIAAKPLWAQMFYLIRTGNLREALEVAVNSERQLNDREPHFIPALRAWVESTDRSIPRTSRERLFSAYNARIAFGSNVDPFKQALFKIIGRIEPHKKTVPLVTSTTEDWIWFQLAMVDEQEGNGLKELGELLESYGEKHFTGPSTEGPSPSASISMSPSLLGMATGSSTATKKLNWARLLLVCGLFEKSVAALYEHPELQVEAIHLAISLAYYGLLRVPARQEMTDVDVLIQSAKGATSLNFALLINRYIRQFQKTDPKEAVQYAFCVGLTADRITSTTSDYDATVSRDQLELTREIVRRVIVNCQGKWEELIGGMREDGTRFTGVLEHYLPLLQLNSTPEYYDVILKGAATMCEEDRRITDAIKLYNLAGARDTVISCLARALGELLSEPGGGGVEGQELENIAQQVIRMYDLRGERTKESQEVMKLIRARSAMDRYAQGDMEGALEAIEASDIIPLDGDLRSLNRRVDQFKFMDPAITRNLGEILMLTMNIIVGLHARTKTANISEIDRQSRLARLRQKAKAVSTLAGLQRMSISSDILGQLNRLEVKVAH
ncbi:hypothetical protein FS837_004435 [Tulasnella sp. UAMH 9824]|nr:hypothetical protein FS837_004435 [Tulasnella sp. UAMH 9824]